MRIMRNSLLTIGLLAMAAACGDGDALDLEQQTAAVSDNPRLQSRALPAGVAKLKLGQSVTRTVTPTITAPNGGTTQVVVQLKTPSVAAQGASGTALAAHLQTIQQEQSGLLSRASGAGTVKVLGATRVLLNALLLEADGPALAALSGDAQVTRLSRIQDFRVDLTETVPYIGAKTPASKGYTGAGVRVAVLDSGIDYHHANLGGSGLPADFAANDPTVVEPGTFPTAKVIGGYDFVGGVWPGGPLAPDADPLDAGAFRGHGTHVADIIGGAKGVAPGTSLLAVKVCSSVATSCSGVAMFLGLEFAVDPNGDGNPSDRVDIVNMSLGSDWGQIHDSPFTLAVDNAAKLGVLTVAAAGNGGNRPFITGTPAAAATAIAVAQTHVPSAFMPFMEVTSPSTQAGTYPAAFQAWSAKLTTTTQGTAQYGDGAGGNLNGCAPFVAGSLTGKIVLVDRGACFFSDKIRNIENGGGALGIIGLVSAGEPFSGAFGGGAPITIPGYMVSQAHGNILRSGLAVVKFSPSLGVKLAGTVVSTSSRGPGFDDMRVKPELGAPGASVSAVAGSGAGEAAFGGTSGATPMVAGAAALLLQVYDNRSKNDDSYDDDDFVPVAYDGLGLAPLQVKALLMNTANTAVKTSPGGEQAPVSRVGGGEVRVDKAFYARAAAWIKGSQTAALSFGFVESDRKKRTLTQTVKLQNFTNDTIVYKVSVAFRSAADAATGAVKIKAPKKVKLKKGKGASFKVKLTINGKKLAGNPLSSGAEGASPTALNLAEYDGHLVLDDGKRPISIPWHVVPRKAARVKPNRKKLKQLLTDEIKLHNKGVGTAQHQPFSIILTSPDMPDGAAGQASPSPDLQAVGVQTYPVPAGYCSANPSFVWAFAVKTWERVTHLLPVIHYVYLDTNGDGQPDWALLNGDINLFGTSGLDGRQLAWAWNLTTGQATAYFYAEHATSSSTTVLHACAEQLGLSGADLLTKQIGVAAYAQDFYFGGPGDFVSGNVITPGGEVFFGTAPDLAAGKKGKLTVDYYPPVVGTGNQYGLLLQTNASRGAGNHGGATADTEALLFAGPGVTLPSKATSGGSSLVASTSLPVLPLSASPAAASRQTPTFK